MGAYIHALCQHGVSIDSAVSPLLSSLDMASGETLLCGEKIPDDAGALVSTETLSVRPGAVPFSYLTEPVHMDGC